VRHEIVTLPSASVTDVLRREKTEARAEGVVAVLADPVLDAGDPRVKRSRARGTAALPQGAAAGFARGT
jgi:hypothetical protein